MTNTQSGDQEQGEYMRWVKATDRRPPIRQSVHIRHANHKPYEKTGGWLHEDGFWVLYNSDTTRDESNIQWLDESPPAPVSDEVVGETIPESFQREIWDAATQHSKNIDSEYKEHAELDFDAGAEWAYKKLSSALGGMGNLEEIIKNRLNEIINTPQAEDFIEAVKCEMAHQQERWGDESTKYPHDFALVLSYLQGKLIKSIFDVNAEKFIHHVITTAAVAGVIHKYYNEDSNTKWYFFPPKAMHQH